MRNKKSTKNHFTRDLQLLLNKGFTRVLVNNQFYIISFIVILSNLGLPNQLVIIFKSLICQ